jgi:hypothetical protein
MHRTTQEKIRELNYLILSIFETKEETVFFVPLKHVLKTVSFE